MDERVIELRNLTREIKSIAEINGLNKDRPFLRPICDGICSIESYFSPFTKVMFILREPYDNFTTSGLSRGGGWSMTRDFFKNPTWVAQDPYQTTFYVAKTANAILDSDFTKGKFNATGINDSATYEVMNRIAYINLSKMPAERTTDVQILANKYRSYWKDLVKKQIKFFNPDIVICGGTFDILNKYEPLVSENLSYNPSYENGRIKTYKWNYDGKKDRLLIPAYHPSSSYYDYDYINGIRQAWLNF